MKIHIGIQIQVQIQIQIRIQNLGAGRPAKEGSHANMATWQFNNPKSVSKMNTQTNTDKNTYSSSNTNTDKYTKSGCRTSNKTRVTHQRGRQFNLI